MVTLGGARRPLPPADDLGTALRAAAQELGQRPAVTVLRADRRDEQGFVSLAQWAAKGAHLLQTEHMLQPGDRLALAGPAGWLPVAACLAAWWAGVTVTFDGEAAITVVHEDAPPPPGAGEVLTFGDTVDGTPTSGRQGEPYTVAVQLFPDQPPPPRAGPELAALEIGGRSWTQRDLLGEVERFGLDGTLGIEATVEPRVWVPAVAVRPLRSGRATVVLAGGSREQAAAEGVTAWA